MPRTHENAPAASTRDDEPTRVSPLHHSGIQMTAERSESTERAEPQAPARHAHSAPFSVPPTEREPRVGRYHVQEPDCGREEVISTRPPARPASAERAAAPGDGDAYYAAAERLMERGDYCRAVHAAQKGMKLQPALPHQQALYAWLLYQRDGGSAPAPAHVWNHIEQALARDGRCALAHCIKGLLLERAGRAREALWHLELAQRLAPHHPLLDCVKTPRR